MLRADSTHVMSEYKAGEGMPCYSRLINTCHLAVLTFEWHHTISNSNYGFDQTQHCWGRPSSLLGDMFRVGGTAESVTLQVVGRLCRAGSVDILSSCCYAGDLIAGGQY